MAFSGEADDSLVRMATQLGRMGGWWVKLPEMQVVWSDEVCRIHGLQPGETPSVAEIFEFYHPSTRGRIRDAFQRCITEGQPFDEEILITSRQKSQVWVRVIGEAVYDNAGAIVRAQGAFQDISKQKELETSLARSRRRFREMCNAVPGVIWIAFPHGEFDYINQSFFDYTGLSPHLSPDTSWQTAIAPEDRADWQKAWNQSIATGTIFEQEVRIRSGADQTYRWHALRAVPSRDEGGKIAYWYGSAVDIHATKVAEARERQLANRLQQTLESIGDAVYALDRAWRFTYLNSHAERLLNGENGQLIGKCIWEEFPDAVDGVFDAQFKRALDEQIPVEFEDYYAPYDAWFNVRVFPSPEGITVYFYDITQSRRSERELRRQAALLNRAQDAIIVRDLDHVILFWNKAAERIYGWSAEEAIGTQISTLIYNDAEPFFNATQQVIEQGEWTGQLVQRHRSGKQIIVQGRWSLINEEDSDVPPTIMVINTDITEQKHMEERLLRAQRLESIGILAGGIAHDLNNALAPILLSTFLLKRQINDESMRQQLEIIETSAERGADMVSQVLTFARGGENRYAIVAVDTIVEQAVRMIADALGKNFNVRDICPQTPWPIWADATQIHQVLVNLIVNARDAMPNGGEITIQIENMELDEQYITMSPEASPGPHVCISVTDSGSGITREALDRIFDPFYTTKEIGQGTGLGLSTVLGIVKSHSGHINVYSELGKGTVFKVLLPAQPTGSPTVPAPAAMLPRGQGQLILVIDDEQAVRTMTRQTLEAFGYRVLTAPDGAAGLSIFVENQDEIDVVITDMMMPVMDGYATIQALYRLKPQLQIIAASGLAANGMVAKAAGVGVQHFLVKPYTAEAMLKLLGSLFQPEDEVD